MVRVAHRQIAATRNSGARAHTATACLRRCGPLVDAAVVDAALRSLRDGAVGGGAAARFEGRVPVYARVSWSRSSRFSGLRLGGRMLRVLHAARIRGRRWVRRDALRLRGIAISAALKRRAFRGPATAVTLGTQVRAYSAWELRACWQSLPSVVRACCGRDRASRSGTRSDATTPTPRGTLASNGGGCRTAAEGGTDDHHGQCASRARHRRHRGAPAHLGDRRWIVRESRRMVRLLRLCVYGAVFRIGVLSFRRSDNPASQCRGRLCRRLSDAPHRQLVLRPDCRPARPAHFDDGGRDHDVRRLADGGVASNLCQHWRCRPRAAAARAPAAGAIRRRRIRHERDVHE